MFRKLYLLALTCFLVTSASYAASAGEVVGVVTKAEGEFTIERKDSSLLMPTMGQNVIFLGDIVETGPDSIAKITFVDETEMTIAENARLRIDEFVYDPVDTMDNEARLSVLKGAFTYVGGLIGKGEGDPNVQLDLAMGSIGIRGTQVWVNMLDRECRIYVEDGEIDVFNKHGVTRLKHGEGSRISSRRLAPSSAEIWGQETIDWIQGSLLFSDEKK